MEYTIMKKHNTEYKIIKSEDYDSEEEFLDEIIKEEKRIKGYKMPGGTDLITYMPNKLESATIIDFEEPDKKRLRLIVLKYAEKKSPEVRQATSTGLSKTILTPLDVLKEQEKYLEMIRAGMPDFRRL